MDILQLIDRLEELFNESKAIPLTRNVMVDEDRMLDIIDQMRIAIPEEQVRGLKLQLVPGMPVECYIRTEDRTVISYLVKPLRDQIEKAFRER